MSQTYSVVFAGELIEGFEVESVKKAFADIFQVKDENVQKYFSGKPRVVKRNLDEETAARYQRVFAKYGANVEVLKSVNQAVAKDIESIKRPVTNEATATKTAVNKTAATGTAATRTAATRTAASKMPAPKKVTRSKLDKKAVENTIQKFHAPVDPSANLIAQGRERQAAKMSRIEIAEESRSTSIFYAGLAAIGFGLVDGAMTYLGGSFEVLELWTSVLAVTIGSIMLFSSNAK
ncbi:hypothetical protein FLL45_09505 [Aliikangiella marina]|uniref:Uncharacterized protein n=1 Tax=Aliikangiella marina TaxID=1712262 RepID=A0A545TD65_9GAMM|nr:hypothetical protein [Aliikangiella marina]TQV75164.1 hypothetical protein FLL45_09505 [Aliikangiella marina]